MFRVRKPVDIRTVEAAVEVARDASSLARESIEQGNDSTKAALHLAELALGQTGHVLNVIDVLRKKIESMPGGEVLTGDELQAFAENVPQWNITSGIVDGRAVKVYQRTIHTDELVPERRRGGTLERETYLRLADVEHSDFGLAQIFGTYSFSGDAINGTHYSIKIHSENPGPITYNDLGIVTDAEAYLVSAGYIQEPELQPLPAW